MTRQPIAIGIVLHDRQVLVGLRARDPWAGYAEFPGGKVLPGETPEAAAGREVLEECGLEVRVERLHSRSRFDDARGGIELHFFLCRLSTDRGTTELRAPFHWVPIQELDSLRFPPANAAVLRWLVRSESGRPRPAAPGLPSEDSTTPETSSGSTQPRSS